MTQLALPTGTHSRAIELSPFLEMGAYETLWHEASASFKRLARRFQENPDALPSDLVDRDRALKASRKVLEILRSAGVDRFGVRIHGAYEYPGKLRDARDPIEVLYFQGWWNYIESKCISVVGTRTPSAVGREYAQRLVRLLVAHDWTVVSGLASGVDTIAHETALEAGGRTIAVLGTPLSKSYPRENRDLQKRIAKSFLLISQIPVLNYEELGHNIRRSLFPQRNITMSAISAATVIVEVGKTRGSLSQARASLDQGRRLFLLEPCFNKPGVTWPLELVRRGAVRVADELEIVDAIQADPN